MKKANKDVRLWNYLRKALYIAGLNFEQPSDTPIIDVKTYGKKEAGVTIKKHIASYSARRIFDYVTKNYK